MKPERGGAFCVGKEYFFDVMVTSKVIISCCSVCYVVHYYRYLNEGKRNGTQMGV